MFGKRAPAPAPKPSSEKYTIEVWFERGGFWWKVTYQGSDSEGEGHTRRHAPDGVFPRTPHASYEEAFRKAVTYLIYDHATGRRSDERLSKIRKLIDKAFAHKGVDPKGAPRRLYPIEKRCHDPLCPASR